MELGHFATISNTTLLSLSVLGTQCLQHCQILALFLLRSFALFTAPDSITDFGTAQAKHCNLVFCSFVLRIDWLKPFLADHAMTCGVNGLNGFICLWCNTTIVTTGRKVRFHHTLPFMTKQKRCSSAAATSLETAPEVRDHWYQCCHFWYFSIMFSDKYLMFDILVTNLMLTGLFFSHFLCF